MYEIHQIPTPWELFRIECGQGWECLYSPLISYIQNYNEGKPTDEQIQIVQIKEKFGGLRFYVNNATEELNDMINKAEDESYHVCEICGSRENIGYTQGYIQTLCHKCVKDFAIKNERVYRWREQGSNDVFCISQDKDELIAK